MKGIRKKYYNGFEYISHYINIIIFTADLANMNISYNI